AAFKVVQHRPVLLVHGATDPVGKQTLHQAGGGGGVFLHRLAEGQGTVEGNAVQVATGVDQGAVFPGAVLPGAVEILQAKANGVGDPVAAGHGRVAAVAHHAV